MEFGTSGMLNEGTNSFLQQLSLGPAATDTRNRWNSYRHG